MKRSFIIVIVAGLLLVASSTWAAGPVTLYGGIGYSPVSSPDYLRSAYASGFHYTVGVGFNLAPHLKIVPKYEHHSFAPEVMGSIARMTLTLYGADARLNLTLPGLGFSPVLLGGIGLATNQSGLGLEGVPLELTSRETDFYYNLGGGLDFTRLTVQLRYISASFNGQALSFFPITVGLKF